MFFPGQNIDSTFVSEDKKIDRVLEFFSLDKNQKKISCFLYKDLEQKYFLSATPGYGNPFPLALENHSVGLPPVEHETIHIIWRNIVGDLSTFFSEGLVGYYYSTIDSLEWKKNRITVTNGAEASIRDYLEGYFSFSSFSYALSAHFVKYLIDKYGLEAFKQFSKISYDEGQFRSIYKKSTEEIIVEWQKYLEQNKIILGPARSIRVKVIADNMPLNSEIYITGDNEILGNWNPALVKLDREQENCWIKDLSLPEGSIINYKITLGNWDTEALKDNGEVPSNSIYEVKADDQITIVVNKWKDLKSAK